jgi:hypothetical protein
MFGENTNVRMLISVVHRGVFDISFVSIKNLLRAGGNFEVSSHVVLFLKIKNGRSAFLVSRPTEKIIDLVMDRFLINRMT